jgi:hypothetical protein
MTMPYFLANFVTSFHAIAKSRGINTNDYAIPVNVDQRQNKEVLNKVFFNHWSMIFFQNITG